MLVGEEPLALGVGEAVRHDPNNAAAGAGIPRTSPPRLGYGEQPIGDDHQQAVCAPAIDSTQPLG